MKRSIKPGSLKGFLKIEKSVSPAKLKEKLDKVFSIYIRLRDTQPSGIGQCISCGKSGDYWSLQNGHFISRRHNSLRWCEINCNAQCKFCNLYDQGAGPAYAQALKRKHGERVLDMLEIRKNNTCKLGRFEFEVLIKLYIEKVSELGGIPAR